MNPKKFVLRIDENMYAAIEKWAADEFRSVNGQIEWILKQELIRAKRWETNKSGISKSSKNDDRPLSNEQNE